MSGAALTILDGAFHLVHGGIMFLNVLGWLFPATRAAGLLVQVLTLCSWFGLGRFRGFGYCLVTDWHSRIQWSRGKRGFPNGYVKFLVDRLMTIDADPLVTDRVSSAVFFVALACSLFVSLF